MFNFRICHSKPFDLLRVNSGKNLMHAQDFSAEASEGQNNTIADFVCFAKITKYER
jgi:hypothetical protein